MSTKVHRRYWDDKQRPDLRKLAKCNNINGAICDDAHLTSDPVKVTCGSCLRIDGSTAVPRQPWSPAGLRRLSHQISTANMPAGKVRP